MTFAARKQNTIKVLLLLAGMIIFAASCLQQSQKTQVSLTSSETPDPIPARVSTKTFEKFSHRVPEHEQFACDTCHHREGRSVKITLGGHESCIGCHLNQFTDRELMNRDKVMCAICHTDTSADNPQVKAFPAKFAEGFNMKFDHAAHTTGRGRPADGCAACHNPSGPGESIPVGIAAHSTCYACHTPESKIGSCNVCHQMAPYNRTTQSEYNFKAIFRHGDHRGSSCNECHKVVDGAPNSRQVTTIAILEHRTTPGNNCLQCHNGRQAFTGNSEFDFASCVRCHKGSGFAKLPPDTAAQPPQ